jgi:hypothetical protein
MTLVFVGALTAASAASAGEAEDLRCEALKMRREGRYYNCLSRCERHAERKAERAGEEGADTVYQECAGGCDAGFEAALDRIQERSVCSPGEETPVPPDPNRCTGKLLGAEANLLNCQARCMTRSERSEDFDLDGCDDRCVARNERKVERILDSAMCDGVEVPVP